MNLFACGFCGKPVLERRASRGSQWTQQVLPTYPLVSCLRIGALIDFGATANFLQLRAIDGTRICTCPKCKHWKGRWVSDSSNRCVCGSLPLACPMSRTRGVTRPASSTVPECSSQLWGQPMNTSPSLRRDTSLLNSRSCLLLVPLLTSFAIVFVVLAHGGDKKTSKEQTKATAGQTKYVRPADPALYVGADTCKTCHDDISANFEKTPHFSTPTDARLAALKAA